VSEAVFRIGELSRRTGVSTDVIRAWERRYGLLRPARSTGNYRLYSAEDVARLRLMRHYTDQNIFPARAAELVHRAQTAALESNPGIPPDVARRALAVLRDSLERFDDAPADRLLRRLLAVFAPGAVLRDVVLPYLRALGERWEHGEASVGQEHFASCFLEGWMLGMARGPANPGRRRAVLACLPGERHALGLMAFGVTLRGLGWRVTYLGTDTPLESVVYAAGAVSADAVVLAASIPETFAAVADRVAGLANEHPVVLGGAGTADAAGPRLSSRVLPLDLVTAAQALVLAHSAAPAEAPATAG
jgi:DNA-binding transcriptional MerR regulator